MFLKKMYRAKVGGLASKNGIALLITLFFIIAITIAVGIGMKHLNVAAKEVKDEEFLLQTNVILDDVLGLLRGSKEIDAVVKDRSSETLFLFLSQTSLIPFESNGLKVIIELKSARSHLNINNLMTGSNVNIPKMETLKEYMNNHMVLTDYVDILLDLMGGIKEDMSYNSEIFYEKPYLFRDYVVSMKHLEEVNDFYVNTYRDNNLKNIDLENIFFASKRDTKIDLNYASPKLWELMLGCDEGRAIELSDGGGSYSEDENLYLSDDENISLSRFNVSFFEPYIDVNVEIIRDKQSSKIRFEYDMINKKGYDFVYEI